MFGLSTKYQKTLIVCGFVGLSSASFAADANVRCLQGQLTQLGQDPGTIDGAWGQKTRAAGEAYRLGGGAALVLPDLSRETAGEWCEVLAAADSALAPFAKARFDFVYDTAENVPAKEVTLIQAGLDLAERYFAKTFEGGIPVDKKPGITVKIVATGKGNQEEGGGGGVATAMDKRGIRPFFDVANVQWNQNSEWRGWTTETDSMKTVIHEYTHGWQASLGALTMYEQPLGNWINEGMAEYVAYAALVDAGRLDWAHVDPFMLNSARQDQLGGPLDVVQKKVWPGHVGFLGISWLVSEAPDGIGSLKTLVSLAGSGKSLKAAFRAAFNVELTEFYEKMEIWRSIILEDADHAFARRPKLTHVSS
jgi:hypothetical protein